MQTSLAILATSSLLPSPPAHDSLSLHYLCIQGGHLHQLSHLDLILFLECLILLKSNEKAMEASSALYIYIWDHHTSIQIVPKPTKALYTAFVHLQWP